ncbi:hypothetical protein A8709_25500 [Paenibacillus pectinilyticus]|uniref:Glycosyl hydrolase n=1 Tax=Paenibacillus pectinilyticus TaxID=512399 RepID=A0A1C1A0Z7_9BACL|nr:hypothetical protein [Paenibacillus pectinilyticus]OCT14192.1 hypothetical protein A8709_25500 [Paenibacillus pectinilyticus]
MRNRTTMLISSLIMLALLTGCQTNRPSPMLKELASQLERPSFGEEFQVAGKRDSLLQFITGQLTGPYGIYTNWQDTDQKAEVATGHEALSESAGLLMRYYAQMGQKDKFEQQWQLAKATFDMKTGFSYRYSPKLQKKFTLNASVDDLRIMRALEEAAIVFHEPSYRKEAESLGKRFYSNLVVDGRLTDFYDESYHMNNSFITLCYIDLATLDLISTSNKKSAELLSNMVHIAKNGYLSDSFPFYQTRYDYKTNSYQTEQIQTVESLLTILNLAEVKQHSDASIRYIKEHIQSDTLFARYAIDGTPLNDVRSTAIYAIAAMIGSVIQDKELYNASIQRMNAFQVQDAQSPLLGGFGDVPSGQAYSFDNLMALLAYVYR